MAVFDSTEVNERGKRERLPHFVPRLSEYDVGFRAGYEAATQRYITEYRVKRL